jgi:hypothetical protein
MIAARLRHTALLYQGTEHYLTAVADRAGAARAAGCTRPPAALASVCTSDCGRSPGSVEGRAGAATCSA